MRLSTIPKHGTEIYRLESPKTSTDLSQWSHLVRSLKSSGTVMEKRVCLTKPLKKYPEGRLFSWSWKQVARMKPSDFPDYVEMLISKGWELTKGHRKLSKSKKESAADSSNVETPKAARTRPTRGPGARANLSLNTEAETPKANPRKPRRLRIK